MKGGSRGADIYQCITPKVARNKTKKVARGIAAISALCTHDGSPTAAPVPVATLVDL